MNNKISVQMLLNNVNLICCFNMKLYENMIVTIKTALIMIAKLAPSWQCMNLISTKSNSMNKAYLSSISLGQPLHTK